MPTLVHGPVLSVWTTIKRQNCPNPATRRFGVRGEIKRCYDPEKFFQQKYQIKIVRFLKPGIFLSSCLYPLLIPQGLASNSLINIKGKNK